MSERLPATLGAELRALREELPQVSAGRLLREARAAALLITWCRRALAEGHLVSTARALHSALGLGRAEMEMLRLPVDLLDRFPRWREGSRAGFRPPAPRLRIAPAAATLPLAPLRVHLAPASGAVPLGMALLHALAERTDRDVPITVMIEPGAAAVTLRRLARRLIPRGREVWIVVARAATAYARDHALAAHDAVGASALLIPRGFRPVRGKEDEALDARGTARALGVRIHRSQLYWEGGNILFDGHRLLVGADLVRENIGRLGLDRAEVLTMLASEFGVEPCVVGEIGRSTFDGTQDRLGRTGQASYHIDLDVCALGSVGKGGPVALLADPDLGLSVLDRVLADRRFAESHGLPATIGRKEQAAEYRRVADERRPRLARYRRQLERAGYRVVAMPELRVDDSRRLVGIGNRDLTCCNALPALHGDRAAVHHLPWGIAALDRLAAKQWRAAGVRPVPLADDGLLAHGMMEFAAGLHCFVGTLAPRSG